jgi:hypothetical protein
MTWPLAAKMISSDPYGHVALFFQSCLRQLAAQIDPQTLRAPLM